MKYHKDSHPKVFSFFFDGKQLGAVTSYDYLAVTFTSSGLYLGATNKKILLAISTSETVTRILTSAKSDIWRVKTELIGILALCVLFYTILVWGLRYTEPIERA